MIEIVFLLLTNVENISFESNYVLKSSGLFSFRFISDDFALVHTHVKLTPFFNY